MRVFRFVVSLVALHGALPCALLWVTPPVAAAQSVNVTVTGTVTDASGGVLPGAAVTATSADTGLVRAAVTDEGGRYALRMLPAGRYEVKAELAGLTTEVRPGQDLHVGTTITLDFALKVGGLSETVEVRTEAPILETTKNTLARTVQSKEIDSLPVIGRNFNELAALAPGVTRTGVYGGVDISGNRDFQNSTQVDGVSAERQSLGDQRIAYSQDWIQEFQVMTGQYNAEFGQASGGVLNAITRSGGNQTIGRVYGYFRDEAWDAMPTFATRKPPLSQQRYGGTVGGPLRRNKLFYFGGVEIYNNESSNIVNSSFPAANGAVPYTQDQQLYLAKVDYMLTPAQTARVRYNTQRSDTTGDSIGGASVEEHGRFEKLKGTDLLGTWTWAASNGLLNETRAGFNDHNPQGGCNFAERNPAGTWFERVYPAATFGCPVNFGRIAEQQFQFIDNLTWNIGAHELKFGTQVQRTRTYGDFRNFRDGRYSFERDTPFSLADPSSYPYFFTLIQGPTAWDVSGWAAGFFVQDSWRVSQDFTLNAGLRYDVDGSLTALNPLVRTDVGMHTIKRDVNNVAPRVGVAWTPFKDEKRTLVRGGVGLYYDQNHNNVATILLLNNILVDRITTINANVPFQNPFATPAEARQFLAQAFAQNRIPDTSGIGAVVGNTNDVDADFHIPASTQVSGGVARQFSSALNVSADLVYSRGFDQYLLRNVNIANGTFTRINPNYNGITAFGNGGRNSYKALQMQATFAPNARHLVKASYTLAKNDNNTNASLSGGGATNPYDFSEDQGPADNDVRHVLSVNGSTLLPFGIQAAGIVSLRSALPYSATTTAQLDSDPWTDRPEPRNARRGDSAFSLDARFSKLLPLGRLGTATGFVELFNLTNSINHSVFIGLVTSDKFGQPTTASAMRRVQLGFRVDFGGSRP